MSLICFKCNSEDFFLNPDAEIEQVFQGETLTITTPIMECKHCGWRVLAEGQLDEMLYRIQKKKVDKAR